MIISHIVAVSQNWIIGSKNRLPWKMPSDAQYFHEKTRGHMVIMGRKNYEANKKALPGRLNIVITRQETFQPTDAITVNSIEQAISYAENYLNLHSGSQWKDEVFIIGGGEIYLQTLNIANRIYLTVIDTFAEGDTYYPKINFSDYKIISEEKHTADERNPFYWTYYVLEPKLKTISSGD